MHSAKIIADSISAAGARLTTMEVVMPRIILAEFNTHRVFSRNSASSRAIPVQKMIDQVLSSPYVPSEFGANQRGMQAGAAIEDQDGAREAWWAARYDAVGHAMKLQKLGVHKQLTNRLLEPFMWHTVIVTSTEWSNFFHLRDNPAAHPDICVVARMMQEAMERSTPRVMGPGEWHLPYIFAEDFAAFPDLSIQRPALWPAVEPLVKISTARCARVSYLTHDGKRDVSADLELYDRLVGPGHMSPLEHPAMAMLDPNLMSGNFRGWMQYRKRIPREDDILRPEKDWRCETEGARELAHHPV